MNYRIAEILSEKDVGGTATETIDINLKDVVSRISVKFATRNPSSITIAETEAANLPKIELVDGSDVLYSLTGMIGQAVDWYDSLIPNQSNGSYVPAWDLVCMVNMNFGRWLYDPLLAFDPRKFRNPQLKITHNENAAVQTTIVNGLTVLADIFDEKVVSPVGFLMNKVLKEYTPSVAAWEEIDIPSDYPHRKLLIQARVANAWTAAIIEQIKLSEDNDKKVPLNILGKHFERWSEAVYPPYWQHLVTDLVQTTGVTLYHIPTQTLTIGGTYAVSGIKDAVPFGYTHTIKSGVAADIGNEAFEIRGNLPHGVLCIPFGDQKDMTDWYDLTGKSLVLKLLGGTLASGTYRIITQQLRRY